MYTIENDNLLTDSEVLQYMQSEQHCDSDIYTFHIQAVLLSFLSFLSPDIRALSRMFSCVHIEVVDQILLEGVSCLLGSLCIWV